MLDIKNHDYYVYQFIDPRTNVPFAVGKGTRHRAYNLQGRSPEVKVIVAELMTLGFRLTNIVVMIKTGLNEIEALQLEGETIFKLGRQDLNTGPLLNKSFGGESRGHGLREALKKRTGKNNPVFGSKKPDNFREYMSEFMTDFYQNDPRGIEIKATQKETMKGNQRAKGLAWWNDGVTEIRAIEQPNAQFKKGRKRRPSI